LLRALDRPEPTRSEAAALLRRWRDRAGRSQRPLASAEAGRFRERLAAVDKGLLGAEVLRSIDFDLSYWAREGG
jgi:hypothetical protein